MPELSSKYPVADYLVIVTNDQTGAVQTLRLRSTGETDAQVEALHAMFRARGWRHCTASLPLKMVPASVQCISTDMPNMHVLLEARRTA
jgi:hypothetical protein